MVLDPRAMGQAFVTPHARTTRYSQGLLEEGSYVHRSTMSNAGQRTKARTKEPPVPRDLDVKSLSISNPGQGWHLAWKAETCAGRCVGGKQREESGGSGSRLKTGGLAWPIGEASVCAPPPHRRPSGSLQTLRSSLQRGHPPPLAQSRPHLPISPSLFRSNSMYFSGNHRAKTGIN